LVTPAKFLVELWPVTLQILVSNISDKHLREKKTAEETKLLLLNVPQFWLTTYSARSY